MHGGEGATYRIHYPKDPRTEVPEEDVYAILRKKTADAIDLSDITYSSAPYNPATEEVPHYELITFEKTVSLNLVPAISKEPVAEVAA